jgi:hypothetical protein
MKKIETLQQLEAEVKRLKNVYTSIKEATPETDAVFFSIHDASAEVVYQAEGLFKNKPIYSNGKLALQYRAHDCVSGFALFLYSVPVSRNVPALNEFSEV